jgi:hypothetical protein
MPHTPDEIVGSWLHSHEEDTATEFVYRRADYEFGPSRGRVGYEFRPDRTCTYVGIAPQDGQARKECTWMLRSGPPPEIVVSFPGGGLDVLGLVSVDRDRLVVRRP